MTTINIDDVFRLLRAEPKGLTTAQLAQRLIVQKTNTLSVRLSKLADYGQIEREFVKSIKQRQRFCVWKAKVETQ